MVPPVVQRTEGRTLGSKAAGNISQKMNISKNRLEKGQNTEIQTGKVQYHTEITSGKCIYCQEYQAGKSIYLERNLVIKHIKVYMGTQSGKSINHKERTPAGELQTGKSISHVIIAT